MGNYNPNYPTVLGNEFAPVAYDPVTIDTASAFGYTFKTADFDDITTARVYMATPPPGNPFRKVISCDVYSRTDVPATGPMRKILVPVSSGATILGGTLVNAGTHEDAVRNPTDGAYVSMTGPTAAARFWFLTATTNTVLHGKLLGQRIADISIRYLITGLYDDYAVPVRMELERPSASVRYDMDIALSGPILSSQGVVPYKTRFGDYNPFWNTTINPNSDFRRHRWEARNGSSGFTGLESMAASGGTNVNLRITTSPDIAGGVEAFRIRYLAMEITYCSESRTASGALDMSAGATAQSSLFHFDIPIMGYSTGFPWSSPAGDEYTAVIGQGYIGAISQTYPVPIEVNRLVPARDTFRGHRGKIIRKTLRAGEEWTSEDTSSVPAVAFFNSTTVFDSTTIYRPSQVYISDVVNAVDVTSPGEAYGDLVDDVAGRTYTHIRFYARAYPGTRDYLTLSLASSTNVYYGPYAQLTPEQFDALPEINNGWKEVTLELSEPWVSLGAGVVRVEIDANSDIEVPWELLGADANPLETTFGQFSYATYGDVSGRAKYGGFIDVSGDMSFMLIQAMPVPTDLAVAPAVQPLSVLDETCGVPVEAMPTGIRYHQLSWTAVNDVTVAGFGHYEIQRRDTTMAADEWETVGQVTAVQVTDMDDYEARVGVVSSYRIRTVHEDGYTSAWSATVTATVAAPGVTGTGVDSSVLILTSNSNPSGNLAYVMTWPGLGGIPTQEFTYAEGDQTDYQQMYLRDYSVAFRPLERGGVSFTRQMMINAAGVPSDTLSQGVVALRDLAWATLPYVCVRDELANRWLTAVEVPSSATRDIPSVGHLVVAPVTFTEVTGTPAPVDYTPGCEGLRLEGLDNYQYWDTPVPQALIGTRVKTDTFTRVSASGWGTADLGGTWAVHGGGITADNTIDGTKGKIASGTVTVERGNVLSGNVEFARAYVEITVPAVATGAAYSTGLFVRYQDASNYYWVRIRCATTGNFTMDIERVAAGVRTTLVTGATISTYTVGTVIKVEVQLRGTYITARCWKDATTPPEWGVTAAGYAHTQTSTLAMTGRIGVNQIRDAANTNAALTLSYDNFAVDTLPKVYDGRFLVRVFDDTFNVIYGTNEFTGNADTEGAWQWTLYDAGMDFYRYGDDFKITTSTKLTEMGLVKNRLGWVRIVNLGDDGAGNSVTQYYKLADDGVTWTLVDSITDTTPVQPVPPMATGALLQVLNTATGGIWTHKFELWLDGVRVASPDFAAQDIGTEAFVDAEGNTWIGPDGRGICATLE